MSLVVTVLLQLAAVADLLRRRTGSSPSAPRVAALAALVFVAFGALKAMVRDELVEAFRVPANSMYPTLIAGEHVLISKLRRTPGRGDVIVFRSADGSPYVKRVIAVGGDALELRDNTVWLNGHELAHEASPDPCRLDEPCAILQESVDGRRYRIAVATGTSYAGTMKSQQVPSGHVFVLGDGRDWSRDSRIDGAIPLQQVAGSVQFVWWPMARFGNRTDAS